MVSHYCFRDNRINARRLSIWQNTLKIKTLILHGITIIIVVSLIIGMWICWAAVSEKTVDAEHPHISHTWSWSYGHIWSHIWYLTYGYQRQSGWPTHTNWFPCRSALANRLRHTLWLLQHVIVAFLSTTRQQSPLYYDHHIRYFLKRIQCCTSLLVNSLTVPGG